MTKQIFNQFELDEAHIVRQLQDIQSLAEKYFDDRLRVLCILNDIKKTAERIRIAYNAKFETSHPDES